MSFSSSWFSRLALLAIVGLSLPLMADPANKKCPMMTDDDAEVDTVVDVGGVPVGLCCGKCEKLWKKNEKYYLKAGIELGLLPQFKGKEAELGLDKVELMPQRFCPLNPTHVVAPDSPSVEYKGQKVYFFSQSALGKWNANPDAEAEKAIKAGLLPQLAKK
ncbi:MAG: hypothetical protein QM796_21545 [Chthoniobacteraceae bacterium]